MVNRYNLLAWSLGALLIGIGASAAVKQDGPAMGTYGAVAVDVTATKVPTAASGKRGAMLVFNNGPATIYCGWDSSVTTSTGMPIGPGASMPVDIGPGPQLYCITTVLQVSPANTRYIEVK
jgi:hypothetical protein